MYTHVFSPAGWTNPPSLTSITEVPRENTDSYGDIALRVSWTPPLYAGGLDRLLFSIHPASRVNPGPVSGDSGVVITRSSILGRYTFKVGVVSEEGADISELSAEKSEVVEKQCLGE